MLRVVNMIPRLQSGETNQDSEPNLAVNPANPAELVGTPFTPGVPRNAPTAGAPAGFAPFRVEQRTTIFKDGPPVRIALHPDGTVYAAYQRWASGTFPNLNVDVVISRDDNWGTGNNPFSALVEPAAP